ncbi:Alginate biosynthesis protein AlgA [Paenibacillus plantiphilus]|uniref:Alginate biosynthesis protein AlgA n=1 Tax=Paenibacillus plantiphilus TaxID=2905650 RepID=A0ABN8GKJ2_9BACL|nr:sugar phosphate nucleotidyltransferase [Paenibacillus plantiphilus]CAH1211453.1 Alginate biosynthesis protein AlgA [Paenibacillus plantiphilus]
MNIVIMAGGKGTRFWPRSVESTPKQFLPFHSDRTMIQETVARFRKLVSDTSLYIAVPQRYLSLLEQQLPDFPLGQLIIEPEQKDTAPCMALAAFSFLQSGDNRPLIFVPSDQYVSDENAFLAAISLAAETASKKDAIVTLGIPPIRPETGFGYMYTTAPESSELLSTGVLRVRQFLEKPTAERASQLIVEPDIYWNSGIFAWRPSTIAQCVAAHQPDIWNSLLKHSSNLAAAYAEMPSLSIDYAVMEQADSIYCIPVQCGWDDLGSWAALRRHMDADAAGNVSQGFAALLESTGNTVIVDDKQAIIIGVHDLIIVSTSNGLLICPKAEEQRLKTWINQFSR